MSGSELFSGHSREYAQFRPHYPAAVVDYLAEIVPRDATVWEAGCGSGQFSLPLASRFDHIIATDASVEQLKQALPHPHIEYRVAPAEASDLPDATVGLSVAAQAAHWFDLERYYAEVRRVSKPDAVIALVTYGSTVIDDAVDAIVQRYYAETLRKYWAPERVHVEAAYETLPFPFDPLDPPPFEMTAEWSLEQLIGYIDTWSASRALRRAEGPAKIQTFTRELAEAWARGRARCTVRWPLTVRAGRVHAGRG